MSALSRIIELAVLCHVSCCIFDFSNVVLFLFVCRFEYVFELFTTKDSFRVYQFAAESEAERAQWMKCVAQVRYHYISHFQTGRNEVITSSLTSSYTFYLVPSSDNPMIDYNRSWDRKGFDFD